MAFKTEEIVDCMAALTGALERGDGLDGIDGRVAQVRFMLASGHAPPFSVLPERLLLRFLACLERSGTLFGGLFSFASGEEIMESCELLNQLVFYLPCGDVFPDGSQPLPPPSWQPELENVGEFVRAVGCHAAAWSVLSAHAADWVREREQVLADRQSYPLAAYMSSRGQLDEETR